MRFFLLSLLTTPLLWSQPVPQLRYDAASIRKSTASLVSEGSGRERIDISPRSVGLRNASLSFAIQWAYGIRFYQLSGPGWLNDQRWDFVAKMQEPHSEAELRLMMRTLLADRFSLVLHKERRPRPLYVLESGKGKSGLTSGAAGNPCSLRVSDGDFVFRDCTMAQAAEHIADIATIDRPVIDGTGLHGSFSFILESAARAVRGGEGLSIFAALTEIGLRLVPRTEPLETLIVDRAEKIPTPN